VPVSLPAVSRLPKLFGVLVLGFAIACAEDPEVEREGGPFPPDPSGKGGSDPGAGGNGPAVPFCAAFEVVVAKCQRCHADPPKFGAPVPFIEIDDFHRPYGSSDSREYYQAAIDQVESDLMPYTALNDPPTSVMPPVEALTSAEKATLLGWLKQGATDEGGTDCP
jgi:hypothetical protein